MTEMCPVCGGEPDHIHIMNMMSPPEAYSYLAELVFVDRFLRGLQPMTFKRILARLNNNEESDNVHDHR